MYEYIRKCAFAVWVLLCLAAVVMAGHAAMIVVPVLAIVTVLIVGIERRVKQVRERNL